MALRHLALMAIVCFVWALNHTIASVVVAHMGFPPLFYAAARMAIVTIALHRFLRPVPRPLPRLALTALLLGAVHFGFLFLGFQTAAPSAAAIVLQSSIPISAVLSVLVLGERLTWLRIGGTIATFVGVLIVMWKPEGLTVSIGLVFMLVAAFALSLGSILVKGLGPILPLNLQAWINALSLLPILSAAYLVEPPPAFDLHSDGLAVVSAVLFSAFATTIFAQTAFYKILQLYEVNIVMPLTVMFPLMAVGLGVSIAGDPFTARIAVGCLVAIGGVILTVTKPAKISAR